jgi:hypothetical protein
VRGIDPSRIRKAIEIKPWSRGKALVADAEYGQPDLETVQNLCKSGDGWKVSIVSRKVPENSDGFNAVVRVIPAHSVEGKVFWFAVKLDE